MNTSFYKRYLSLITLDLFKEVVTACLENGLTSHAPLGSSGEYFMLYGFGNRDRQLSVRLHNATVELLITDCYGHFIFYGKFHKKLGVDFIAAEFFRLFNELKTHLENEGV